MYAQLNEFFTQNPISRSALQHLKEGVPIGLVVPQEFEGALFRQGAQIFLNQSPAKNPDVVFYVQKNSMERLLALKTTDVGEFGVEVLREYLTGGVRIHVLGSLWGLTTHGYLGIMKEAGPSFAKFLASHGVGGIGKVFDHISKLRRKPGP